MILAITADLCSNFVSAENYQQQPSNSNQKEEQAAPAKNESEQPTEKELEALKFEGIVNFDVDKCH